MIAHPPFTAEHIASTAYSRPDGLRPSHASIASMIDVVATLENAGIEAVELRAWPSVLGLTVARSSRVPEWHAIETHASGAIYSVASYSGMPVSHRVRFETELLASVATWLRRVAESAR